MAKIFTNAFSFKAEIFTGISTRNNFSVVISCYDEWLTSFRVGLFNFILFRWLYRFLDLWYSLENQGVWFRGLFVFKINIGFDP